MIDKKVIIEDAKVIKQERGWGGHFICADQCLFRRNTLLNYEDIYIVVSTVGNMKTFRKKDSEFYKGPIEEIGLERYYETMVFYSKVNDTKYHDVDIDKQIEFNSNWHISELYKDNEANQMHDTVVSEIEERLLKGEFRSE